MGNYIGHVCYPELEWLHMSNGLTSIVFDALAMSTSLLATSPWEVRVARWMCLQDQSSGVSMGPGWLGFDLDELGWTADDLPSQRAFLLRAIGFARAAARWLFAEPVGFDWLERSLAQLFTMVEAVDTRILGPRPPSPWAPWADDDDAPDDAFWRGAPPEDYGSCPLHGCYLHELGCIVCHSFDAPEGVDWRLESVRGAEACDPPWLVASREPIPVRRFVRMMTRRSFEPAVLEALRPKQADWSSAYRHVLAAFAADPFGLIATTGVPNAYELEARHYLAEWASGRALTPVDLLGSILTTSFASAPRFPGRLGQVLQALERLDESLIGLEPRTTPGPMQPKLWPRTPHHALLTSMAPPPPKKGNLALSRGVVFPEVGEELIGFIRVEVDWMSHVFLGPPDASARINLRIERPLEWVSAGCGDPLLAYPGSGVQLASQRMPLSAVSGWLHQSHVHLVVLGPGDRVLRMFQVPMGPEPSSSHADDRSGHAQFEALRAGRISGKVKTMVEIAAGRIDHTTNPAARLRHLRYIRDATARSERAFNKDAVPQVFVHLLARIDELLDTGRLDEVTALAEFMLARTKPDILILLVSAHAELRGGPNRHTHALALLWGLLDPSEEPN